MLRNVVLGVSTLAVLIVVLVGYTALVSDPGVERGAREEPAVLPKPDDRGAEPIRVGDEYEVPGGGKIIFRVFDERTGRPTDMFSCRDWQPVQGAKDEIHVSGPELAMLLPSGMIATIQADEGQVTVDRIERSQMRPKLGWLAGHVRIVVDRETSADRRPWSERPEDVIAVELDRLSFDLELGELRTEERVVVRSEAFEVAGTGLHLVWNQADNRVETLTIDQGEEFVLYGAAGLFGGLTAENGADEGAVAVVDAGAGDATPPPATKPALRRRARRHRATAYQCVLDGGLVAEQYSGGERAGAIEAEGVRVLFDVGGNAGRLLNSRPTTTAPTSRPVREKRDRLVLRWQGRLHLGPVDPLPEGEAPRRQFEAVGDPVILTRGEGTVQCRRLRYHDETQRIWLDPVPGGRVAFAIGEKLSALSSGVYIDRRSRLVKLVGDVELRSERGTEEGAVGSSIRSAYWAELRIAESTGAAGGGGSDVGVLGADQLESATFVGDVQVDLGEQVLTGHRLDIAFRPGDGEQTLEEMLDTATASGRVQLVSGDSVFDCGQLDLAFATNDEGTLYPWFMDAVGAVHIRRGRARLTGSRVTAHFASPESGEGGQPLFVLRDLRVVGEAELFDPENKVAARGEEIAAAFAGINRLTTATVTGGVDKPGLVHASPFTVRGGRIVLDRDEQTLDVAGVSRLSFKSRRSLQGERRSKAVPIVVTCLDELHIDGRGNEVRFAGDVVARSGDEQLKSDILTLVLEDSEEPEQREEKPWRELWRQMRALAGDRGAGKAADDPLASRMEASPERVRKEPVRLVAENALVTSEMYEGDALAPAVHASISAPHIAVDIVNRQIVTTGLTQLLLTDRRGGRDEQAARDVLGVSSALISGGPSQTAMQCEERMTYTLGEEGPGRRDTVLFEGAVLCVHRTGREMVNLERMLPEVMDDPALLETLKSRNASLDCRRLECWFVADAGDDRPRRGGALTRAPLRLASLMASGSVYLRDQEGSRIREVNAEWVEFSREQERIDVRGSAVADARVYFEDMASGESDVHSGASIRIDLRDGTVRAGAVQGELRRP